MPITYGGVPLDGPTDRLAAGCAAWWHQNAIEEFSHPGYDTRGIDHLPIPAPPPVKPPRPGVLVWPTGASRWAVFCQFVTGDSLTRIRLLTGPQSLAITDGPAGRTGTTTITTSLYALPARPVFAGKGRDNTADIYLLTLVDDRFRWWQHGDQPAPASPASWSALISGLLSAVGVGSPTIDAIDAAYSTPTAARWAVGYKPLPLLIDAACATVGRRVVRKLDGTVAVVGYATASTSDDSQYTTYAGEVMGGGRVSVADIGAAVPASVAIIFPGDTPATTTKTLTGLALSQYGAAAGRSGSVGQVIADMPATAGSTPRANYATQAATDWYLWQLGRTDATFRALVNWVPTGLEDHVSWEHQPDTIRTAVVRRPWHDPNQYGDGGPAVSGAGFARLTTSDGSDPPVITDKWKFVRQKLVAGAWGDDGTETTDYVAVASTLDGTVFCKPAAGLRVFVWPSKTAGLFEFLPVNMAAHDWPGLVSTDSDLGGVPAAVVLYSHEQVLGQGRKAVSGPLRVNTDGTLGRTGLAAGADPDDYTFVVYAGNAGDARHAGLSQYDTGADGYTVGIFAPGYYGVMNEGDATRTGHLVGGADVKWAGNWVVNGDAVYRGLSRSGGPGTPADTEDYTIRLLAGTNGSVMSLYARTPYLGVASTEIEFFLADYGGVPVLNLNQATAGIDVIGYYCGGVPGVSDLLSYYNPLDGNVWAAGVAGGIVTGNAPAGAAVFPFAAANNADWAGGAPAPDIAAALDRIAAALTAAGFPP